MSRVKELEKLSDKAEGKVDRKLFNFYKQALSKLKKETKKYVDEFENLSISGKMSATRKLKMADTIDKILKDLSKDTQTNMYDFLKDKATDGYLGMFYDLEGKARIGLEFNMIDERYIETLVNKKVAGKTYSQRLYTDRTKLAKQVKSELLDGAVNGKGYAKIAKGIAETTEASYRQALRIARTEGHRVQTESTQRAYEEAEDLGINIMKQWMASLDDGTRENHADLDGQIVGIDDDFEIDGYSASGPGMFGDAEMDINCRCTTITIVEGISPQLRKDNITKEIIPYKNYNEWKKDKVK